MEERKEILLDKYLITNNILLLLLLILLSLLLLLLLILQLHLHLESKIYKINEVQL